jgi:hypothetical protein
MSDKFLFLGIDTFVLTNIGKLDSRDGFVLIIIKKPTTGTTGMSKDSDIINQPTTTPKDSVNDDEDPIMLSHFTYLRSASLRRHEKEEMRRLNYMASRIRAALDEWVGETVKVDDREGIDMWWWNGLRNEMVRSKHS